MTVFDWVAIAGALAWVPTIYSHFVKPKLQMFPDSLPEIGYHALGPMFNLKFALSASRKDAIIERMTAEIRHERGDFRILTWALLSETMSQVKSTSGDSAEVSKNQPALALKVSTSLLVEKLVGFQDKELQAEARTLGTALDALVIRHRKLQNAQPAQIQGTKEYQDYIDFFKQRQFWKPGRYTVVVRAYLAGKREPASFARSFSISPDDADRLSNNLSGIIRQADEILADIPVGARTPDVWAWVNPSLEPADRASPKVLNP